MDDTIRKHLEGFVYALAAQIHCEGWAREMVYQLLKDWARRIIREEYGQDWGKWCCEVSERIYAILPEE